MKGKGILDRKGTDKTVRKQERKKATFYCSFVSLNGRYLVEVSIGGLCVFLFNRQRLADK